MAIPYSTFKMRHTVEHTFSIQALCLSDRILIQRWPHVLSVAINRILIERSHEGCMIVGVLHA